MSEIFRRILGTSLIIAVSLVMQRSESMGEASISVHEVFKQLAGRFASQNKPAK